MNTNSINPESAEDLKTILGKGAQVSLRNDGHHWVISKGNVRIDYWPSREKFQVTKKTRVMQGFKSMIAEIDQAKEV